MNIKQKKIKLYTMINAMKEQNAIRESIRKHKKYPNTQI